MKQNKSIYIFVFAIVAIFYVFNIAVPFHSDDLSWVKDYSGLNALQFLREVFERQTMHFLTQNGRITCHAFLQIIVAGGEQCFNVCNTIFFVVSILLTYRYAMGSFRKRLWLPLAMILISFLYLCPTSQSLFFWAAGALNYLMPAMLIISVVLLKEYIQQAKEIKWYSLAGIVLLAFITGWSHEMFVLPVACTIVLNVIYQRKNFNWKLLYLYLPFCLGTLLVVASPGTIHRLIGHETGAHVSQPIVLILLNKLLVSFKMMRDGRLLYVVLLGCFYLLCVKRNVLFSFIRSNAFLVSCMVFSMLMMGALGAGGRAIWGIEFFSLILLLRYFNTYHTKWMQNKKVGMTISALILVHQILLIQPFFKTWNQYKDAYAQTKSSNFNGTIVMDNWHSECSLIDDFISHPYENIQNSEWERSPLKAEAITHKTYNAILMQEKDTTWREPRYVGDMWVIPQVALSENTKSVYYLKAISFEHPTENIIATIWHMTLQSLYSQRYPTKLDVTNSNMGHITVNNNLYVFYRVPMSPIRRVVESVEIDGSENN